MRLSYSPQIKKKDNEGENSAISGRINKFFTSANSKSVIY